jgi:four helix bundle protein
MLKIYDVTLDMAGDVAGVAEAIERKDADLARQLRRAAQSVVLNVAEGASQTAGHKRQRYQTALGSAREVLACVEVAQRMRIIGRQDDAIMDRMDRIIATLMRLVHFKR